MEQHTQPQQQVHGGHNFSRNICDCKICKENCKIIPGYLAPDDCVAIYGYLNPAVSFVKFTKLFFLASPGAIIMKGGELYRIPTIVPARNKTTDHCIFFTNDEKCSIHPVAPFGCRYFAHFQSGEEADAITKVGLYNIIISLSYAKLWDELWKNDLRAKPPEELRKRFVRDNDFFKDVTFAWKDQP